jgi:hypothetical protein
VSYPQQLPREFRMAQSGGFLRMLLPFVAVLVLFFLLALAIGWALGGPVGGWSAAVVGTGILVGVLYKKFARLRSGTVVRFSEYGVELFDSLGFHVRLGWRDMTHVGRVEARMAAPDTFGEEIKVWAGAMKSLGVLGWGDRVVPPTAPAWMQVRLNAQPRNPRDGRPLVAIPLGGIDKNWVNGPMGQWMRMYRPDLLARFQPRY